MHSDHAMSIQTVFARSADGYIARELRPAAQALCIEGMCWGAAEEICSPAYWAAQAWMWEVEAPDHFRLGRSLEEELIACLLGGYGIPAEVGLAAYDRLREIHCEDPDHLLCDDAVLQLLRVLISTQK